MPDRLRAALDSHAKGRLDEADALYVDILKDQPRHFEALQWLATLRLQRGDFDSAIDLFDKVLAVKPDHALCLNNRAAALCHQGRFDEALPSSEGALERDPNYADAHFNRGNALRGLKRSEHALEAFRSAHRIKPEHALAHGNEGALLREMGRLEEAVQSLDRALAIWPGYVEALGNRALALLDLERFGEALTDCDDALAIRADLAPIHNVRGIALRQLGRQEEALQSYGQAIALKPGDAKTLNNQGIALRDQGRPEEALRCYERALDINPLYADACSNRGNALRDLNRLDEALNCFDRARAIAPAHADAHWNESLCRLLKGDFERGWQEYEWRWKVAPQKKQTRVFSQPLWLGQEDIDGKTVLLHAEQGLGDTIQFCRFVRQVVNRGANVILEVQAPLRSLMKELDGKLTVLTQGEQLPAFDSHCPLMSLPLALGADLSNIDGRPYLTSDAARLAAWKVRLGSGGRMKIGLAWSGASAHDNDRRRSIALKQFRELRIGDADYFCLQNEVRPSDRQVLQETPEIRFFGNELQDLAETAALIDAMHLVIAVDTGIAHLAAAMGKPVWILLPFSPDWRWLLGRSDTPWYRTATLFRQSAAGDWDSVLAAVKVRTESIKCI